MRENGLALATSMAGIVNSIILLSLYNKKQFFLFDKHVVLEMLKIFFCSSITMLIGCVLNHLIHYSLAGIVSKYAFVTLCVICVALYVLLLYLVRVNEIKTFVRRKDE